MTLKELVLARVDPVLYYKWRFPEWHAGKGNVICPFHQEANPSLSINLDGGGARCWSDYCGERFGNIVHFESKLQDYSEEEAAKTIYFKYCAKSFDPKPPHYARILKEDMGLEPDWSNFFGVYWDEARQRAEIPIFDPFGYCVAIRKYRPRKYRNKYPNEPKIRTGAGGTVQIFPWQCIPDFDTTKPLFFLKSEKCTMLALQAGLQAFCTTGGESYWTDDWNVLLDQFKIYIWHDDEADLDKKLKALENASPLNVPEGVRQKGDFTEYILRGGRAKHLLKWTEIELEEVNLDSEPATSNENEIPLANMAAHLNESVRVRALVSAKTDKVYSVPSKFEVRPIGFGTPKMATIASGRDLLGMIQLSDDKVEEYVRKHPLVNVRNGLVKIIERTKITDCMEIIPMASVDGNERYITQRCYHIGEEDIEANVPYEFTVTPTTNARTQEVIGVITKKKLLSSSIDEFMFTPAMEEKLSCFRSEEGGEWDKICNVANALTEYTRIRSRLDWHICALLTWASPLWIKLPKEEKERGWLNTLAIGDSHTGKSEVARQLRDLFHCGDYANSENCTYVGLVGGAVKAPSGQFMLRWGKIPINDRRLVILEELSGLSTQDISNLSDIRSSGIARLDKGGLTSQVKARTRLLCISNTRASKFGGSTSLSGHLSGVRAIQKLIGQPEDIGRFDLICTLVAADVNYDEINSPFTPPPSEIMRPRWRDLISFIWALKEDQIDITKEAYERILFETRAFGKRYHASVPIFNPASGRYKLARVASAIACALFNWNGEKIVVTEAHVDCASKLLKLLYDKPSMGYKDFSDNAFHHETVREDVEVLRKFKQKVPSSETRIDLFSYLIHKEQFSHEEFAMVANIHLPQVNELMHYMIRAHLVQKGELNLFYVTKIGKEWIENNLRTMRIIKDGKNELYGRLGVNGTNGSHADISRLSELGGRSEKKRGIKFVGSLAHLDAGSDESEPEGLED